MRLTIVLFICLIISSVVEILCSLFHFRCREYNTMNDFRLYQILFYYVTLQLLTLIVYNYTNNVIHREASSHPKTPSSPKIFLIGILQDRIIVLESFINFCMSS